MWPRPSLPSWGGGWTAQRLEVRPWACCSSSAPVPSSLYPFQPSSACGSASHLPEKPSCPLGWPHVQKMNQFLLCAPHTASVGRQVLRRARARTHTHARARSPPPPGHAGPGPPGFEQVLLERFLYLGQVSTSWGSGSSPVQQGDMRPTSWGCYKDHTLRIPPP